MYLGFYNFYSRLNQNRMFQNPESEIGDELGYPLVYLSEYLRGLGIKHNTIDLDDLEKFDAIVFFDFPTVLNRYYRELVARKHPRLFLVLFEGPAVRPDNWFRRNHRAFRKVLTWSPELADGKDPKYVQFSMPHRLPEFRPYAPSAARKFCCVIASQKYSWDRHELYSERVRTIRWFERNHPDEFDLFGTRWDRWYFKGKLSLINPVLHRIYQAHPKLPRSNAFPSWRGTVKAKRDILPNYRFTIAYENSAFPGWITEKMLDAMFAGSVPVYWGDPRVTDQIPARSFIDRRKFDSHEELYDYLKGMSDEDYEDYRKAAQQFIFSNAIKPFGAEAFAKILVDEISGALR